MFDLSRIGLPSEGVLVDVGASTGMFYKSVLPYMTPTKSLCVEMLGDLADALYSNPVYYAPWRSRYVSHCACGEKACSLTTRRVVFHYASSLLPCNEGVGFRLGHDMTQASPDKQEIVRVETLDTLCLFFDIQKIDLLKIDVQGYESRVLTGAEHILKYTDRVIIEIIIANHYEGQSDPEEIRRLLTEAGLHFASELHRDTFPNGEVLEVDELWVR